MLMLYKKNTAFNAQEYLTRWPVRKCEAPRPKGRGFCLAAVLRGGEQTGQTNFKKRIIVALLNKPVQRELQV